MADRQGTAGAPLAFRAMRNADLGVLALALPIFLAGGLPLGGYAAGALAWIVQRAIKEALARRAEAADDPRTTVGLIAGGMIGRGWLVAGAIFGVGLANEEAGLAAAVLFLAAFTVQFTMGMILRPLEEDRS